MISAQRGWLRLCFHLPEPDQRYNSGGETPAECAASTDHILRGGFGGETGCVSRSGDGERFAARR